MRVHIIGLQSMLSLIVSFENLVIHARARDRQEAKKESTRSRDSNGGSDFICLARSLARSFCAALADFPLAPLSAQFLPVFNSNGLRQQSRVGLAI